MKRMLTIVTCITLSAVIMAGCEHLVYGHPATNTNADKPSADGSPATEQVINKVIAYAHSQREDDPLIEIETDLWVKESNIAGIEINETTYYYSLYPHMSYDPVTSGDVDIHDIEVLYEEEDTAFPIIIYTIRSSSRS